MPVVRGPFQIQFHGFVVGQANRRGFCCAATESDQVELDVFDFLLTLGHRRSHESHAGAVMRDADLTDTQRRARDCDCSGRGARIFFRIGKLF